MFDRAFDQLKIVAIVSPVGKGLRQHSKSMRGGAKFKFNAMDRDVGAICDCLSSAPESGRLGSDLVIQP
jgi:hypothetical protein